ncbi:MAG: hypothetical protein RSA63_00685, partial [Eubacterium sp.]
TSVVWEKRWSTYGEFEFHLDTPNKLLKNGFYIMLNDDPYKVGVIEYDQDDGDGYQYNSTEDYTVKGYGLLFLLYHRITVPTSANDGYLVWNNKPAEDIMHELVDGQAINPIDSKRKIPSLVAASNAHRGNKITFKSRLKYLPDELYELSIQSGLGVAVKFDVEHKQFVFEVLSGVDRKQSGLGTAINPNAYVFSKDNKKVKKHTYTHDTTAYKNMAYIGGQGDGDDRTIVTIKNDLTGLDRREAFIDARDIADEDTADGTKTALTDRGQAKLDSNFREVIAFEYETITDDYMELWDLGDTCTYEDVDTGVRLHQQVTEVRETHEGGNLKVDPTFGYTENSVGQSLQSTTQATLIERSGISAKFTELYADVATINVAIIGKADIADLNAANGKIVNLEAGIVTITGNLNAAIANIGSLEASYADINNLLALKATIEDLNATNARILTLETGYADIETLVAAKATIESLNAAVARIGKLETDQLTASELIATKATIESLNAAVARIGKLEVDQLSLGELIAKKATIDQLNAVIANIETLTAAKADIKDLTAATGRIDTLETGLTTANQLIALKASIEDLNAAVARINTAEIGVANINTLLAGSTVSGSTQTIVLNAKNATLDQAFIKSGIAAKMAVGDLQAGKISTDKFTVGSADGRISMASSTLQVKDATRVRIQIGKDATGDYSMSVYDASGNLMWDARGAKAAAIKDKIIVNDMVSDSAGIAGNKLNIPSVVTQINAGTTLIKSSLVSYDPNGQTLDVLFGSLKTTVDEAVEDIQSNTTAISVANGKISTLITDVSQTAGDLSTLTNRYNQTIATVDGIQTTIGSLQTTVSKKADGSTVTNLDSKVTSLQTSVNGLTSSVSSVQTTANSALTNANKAQSDIDGLEVGGRNLLAKNSFSNSNIFGNSNANTFENNGIKCSGSVNYSYTGIILKNNLVIGQEYTFSAIVSSNANATYGKFSIGNSTTNIDSNYNYGLKSITPNTVNLKVVFTFVATTNNNFSMVIYPYAGETPPSQAAIMQVYNIKLEKGNKPTDWTPAPEDVDASIATVDGKFANYSTTTQMNSAINQKADSITSSVSATYATKGQLQTTDGKFANYSTTTQMNSAITQKADAINLEVAKKVGATEIISKINQSAESVAISASKINLEGSVTISALENGLASLSKNVGENYTDSQTMNATFDDIRQDLSVGSIANWCWQNNLTYIDGGRIYAKSVTSQAIDVDNLSAISANLGTVTTGVIQSPNYASGGDGIELDFRDSNNNGLSVRSNTKNTTLKIDADGTRVYNNRDSQNPVAQFVDTGVDVNHVNADSAIIAGMQMTKVGSEVWITSVL